MRNKRQWSIDELQSLRRMILYGFSWTAIASHFDVSRSTIRKIWLDNFYPDGRLREVAGALKYDPPNPPDEELDDDELPTDCRVRLSAEEQDSMFCVAMLREIKAGREHAPIGIVTEAGAPDARHVPAAIRLVAGTGSPAALCADSIG